MNTLFEPFAIILQLLLPFLPLMIFFFFVFTKISQAKTDAQKKNRKTASSYVTQELPSRGSRNKKSTWEQIKEEFQRAYEEELAQTNKSKAAPIKRNAERPKVTQELSREQKIQQEELKLRLIAEQHAKHGSLPMRQAKPASTYSQTTVKKPVKKIALPQKSPLITAMIYKEILDKPVALREEKKYP